MTTTKKPFSTAPFYRRPAKARKSGTTYDLSVNEHGPQDTTYLPREDLGLGYPSSLEMWTRQRASEALQSTGTPDTSLEYSFTPRPYRISAGSPLDILPRGSDNGSHLATKKDYFSLQHMNSFPVGNDNTEYQDLPNTAQIINKPDDDFGLDGFHMSFTPSDLLACMVTDFPSTTSEDTEALLAQSSDQFSAETGDKLVGMGIKHPENTLKSLESNSDNTSDCMTSALEILQTLYVPPATCLSVYDESFMSIRGQPRLMDSVLSTNREVITRLSGILDCTCSQHSQVQLVLTIICSKLIAWYRAVIRKNHDSENSSCGMASSMTNDNMGTDQTEHVLHQPISMGAFSFGTALESKLRAQVVVNELQHLEAFIETLSRRAQDGIFGGCSTRAAAKCGSAVVANTSPMAADKTGLAAALHRHLTTNLLQQLQVTKKAAIHMLNEEHGPACYS
ncbi:hypothetical protein MMC17_004269 [Xylographa soralifera]|nr:hypothetical protein [Xylographa soralifera]